MFRILIMKNNQHNRKILTLSATEHETLNYRALSLLL